MTTSRFWAELTTRDFAALDAARTVAVLPLGATEQHGPHLPLGVDQVLVDAVVQAALPNLPADLPVLVLPTQRVGYSPEHARFDGTLTVSAATLMAMWTEIGECVSRAGVRKLLLLNGHGGQVSLMDIVARELRARCRLIAYSCSWWNLPLGEEVTGLFTAEEHRFGVHAGDIETSMMLALQPGQVHMDQARHFGSSAQQRAERYAILGDGRSAKLGWQMQDYNTRGAAGNAAAASAEKGRALVSAAGAKLALLLQELCALPLGTLVDDAQP